jgi:hypothetical protein
MCDSSIYVLGSAERSFEMREAFEVSRWSFCHVGSQAVPVGRFGDYSNQVRGCKYRIWLQVWFWSEKIVHVTFL